MRIRVTKEPWENTGSLQHGNALVGLTLKVADEQLPPGSYAVSLEEVREMLAMFGRRHSLTFFQSDEVAKTFKLTPKGNMAIPAFACTISR